MTSPNTPTDPPARPRLRAGQPVAFTHPDPTNGEQLVGKGIVVRVGADGESVAVLPLSLFHLEVSADNVQPVKAEDLLPPALQAPAADDATPPAAG